MVVGKTNRVHQGGEADGEEDRENRNRKRDDQEAQWEEGRQNGNKQRDTNSAILALSVSSPDLVTLLHGSVTDERGLTLSRQERDSVSLCVLEGGRTRTHPVTLVSIVSLPSCPDCPRAQAEARSLCSSKTSTP